MESDPPRTRFLTAIGHDMRQPLHALLLYLDALDLRVREEEARTVLSKADRAAHLLADMLESLTSLARLDAGKIEPDITSVSLDAMFADLIARTPAAKADATQLCVSSDPVLLRIILQNLVSNAVKHGGGQAQLSAQEQNGGVEIAVGDSGPGIAAEDHERIFAEFTRLEGASPDGLGLGLTIAKRLAALLGHAIEVRSAPAAGAEFIVRAPRA